MRYAPIGSISTGTLLPRDLFVAFCDELARLACADDDGARKTETLAELAKAQPLRHSDSNDSTDEALDEFIHVTAPELFKAYCAPYTYFGSHPGDGADIGVWPDIDAATENARFSCGVLQVDAGAEWPALDEDIEYVLEVNDHGNATLYEASTRREVWACV